MPLTNVYTGANGTLTLANQDTPEGQDAKRIMDLYELQTVGRVTNVELHVNTAMGEYHEIGRRHPVSLHAGNIHVSGKIGRAYINGSLLWLLLGRGASPNSIREPFVQPVFNMSIRLNDSAVPGNTAALEVQGVKLQSWAYGLPEDDFVMENVTFRALAIHVLDSEAPAGGGEPVVAAPAFAEGNANA